MSDLTFRFILFLTLRSVLRSIELIFVCIIVCIFITIRRIMYFMLKHFLFVLIEPDENVSQFF